ncbi:PD-(D/E)XK nuclease family protein [Leptogranulimonas caecicola]|uniref:PD-(D/E)XK nuclease family protein n=1 Tax=Leptogranulimonas caecicola TaxID=2894156 RepID=UPI001BEE804D|nr:hypothetical protein ATOBIA_N04570 [Atopobiaceae bacterium P1]
MALYNYLDHDGQVLGTAAMGLIRQAAQEKEPCVLLVPSSTIALRVRKELADLGLAFNIDVQTPLAWAQGLWARVGDGRKPATLGDARLAAWKVLGLEASRGYVALIANLAQRASGLLRKHDYQDDLLSEQQKEAVAKAQEATSLLESQQLITRSDLYAAIPAALGEDSTEPIYCMVATGFSNIDPLTAGLLGQLASVRDLHYACSAPDNPAGSAALSSAGLVSRSANQAGAQVGALQEVPSRVALDLRTPELAQLVRNAFGEEGARIDPQGSVVLLEAAGPEAEAELMARALVEVADEGADHILAITQDVEHLWDLLSSKLAARGLGVRASWVAPAAQNKAVNIFLGFCIQVSQLLALKDHWQWAQKKESSSVDEEAARLLEESAEADRRWWPPRDVVDFLLSSFSGVDQTEAYKADQVWRGLRTLAPAQVLEDLHALAAHNLPLKAALEALGENNWVQAAAVMQANAKNAKQPEVFSALGLVAQAAYELEIADIVPDDPQTHAALILSLLEVKNLPCSFERGVFEGDVRCQVEMINPAAAEAWAPQTVGTVLWSGQTSAENPVSSPRGALPELLALLGMPEGVAPDEVVRSQAFTIWAIPTHRLLIERSLRDTEAMPTHPSPALSELLSLYKEKPTSVKRGEDLVAANLSLNGFEPEPSLVEESSGPELLKGETLELALKKRGQQTDVPVLSPTALEHYMACPRRWFFEYGLPTNTLDAEFSPLEKGNLVHKTLERTVRSAVQEGIKDEQSMIETLKHCFAEAVTEGMLGESDNTMPIPHSYAEEQDLAFTETNLEKLVTDNWLFFEGFTPQAFEYRFGFEDQVITYGGTRFRGYIDRIDVDAEGHALVIDYKSSSAAGKYLLPSRKQDAPPIALEEWQPRYIQAFLYASVLKQLFPELTAVGGLYLMTGSNPGQEGMADMALVRSSLHPMYEGSYARMNPRTLSATFDEVLGRAEECAAQAINGMFAGDVYAKPVDSNACKNCPVLGCDKRK